MLENWQSEFLQFTLFILATVWLVQKGSNESKQLDEVGLESDRAAEGRPPCSGRTRPARPSRSAARRLAVRELARCSRWRSIFLLSWGGQSLNNWRAYNDDQREHGESTLRWSEYVVNADFWERSLENWQSEFLAVGTLAVFTVYLRQRGSPESKPVGAPHDETAASGCAAPEHRLSWFARADRPVPRAARRAQRRDPHLRPRDRVAPGRGRGDRLVRAADVGRAERGSAQDHGACAARGIPPLLDGSRVSGPAQGEVVSWRCRRSSSRTATSSSSPSRPRTRSRTSLRAPATMHLFGVAVNELPSAS